MTVNSVHKLTRRRIIKYAFNGVNKLCAQCSQECKQWQQVKVVNCPFFKSKQQQSAKVKEGGTLQA